jgi:putative hydrolase of the HAD superfamily
MTETPSTHRFRAVAFDLWETLITDPPEISRQQEAFRLQRLEEILAERGWPQTAEQIHQAHRHAWVRCNHLYWSRDIDIPTRRQIVHFLESLELDPEVFDEPVLAEIEHAYATAALEIPPAVTPGARETLEALRAAGLRIGLISNTGRTPGSVLREVLRYHGLDLYIDAMVFSNEHGECKPRPSIFERLREQLGVPYEEIVFVGDNLYVDVHGAQLCGMTAIHYVPETRGLAVAPVSPNEPVEITPEAMVTRLEEIPQLLPQLGR